ncbi:uncharacterized protein [Nicotiana tomentosiformis]|uniref:uncharacterized protein n=1 Tax=Nicotiana tomentosiformis TaxID=4098 RepID=UPI00388CC1EF
MRTRTTGSYGQSLVPSVWATRGQGRGRGRGVARTTVREAPVEPPITLAQEQVPDIVEPAGPAQAPVVPIVIPGLQEALAQILTVCTSLAQIPGALPVQPVAAAQAQIDPITNDEEQKRLYRFGRLHPPTFSGTESEDAQDFLDRCEWMLRTSGILETSGVSFTTFQLTRAAFRWWETYERSRTVGTTLSWQEFSVLFLEKFVPQTHREELRRQFEYLCQEDLSVTQYEMRFLELSHHAVWLVPTEREKIGRFINGLNHQFHFVMTLGNVAGVKFDEVVDSARRLEMIRIQEREEREAKRSRGSGNSSGVPSRG